MAKTKADEPCYSANITDLFDTDDAAKKDADRLRRAGYPKVRTFVRGIDAGGASAYFHVVVTYSLRNGGEHDWKRKPYSKGEDACEWCRATRKTP
jgi:hypothetical protein